jgi:hypothetical protein
MTEHQGTAHRTRGIRGIHRPLLAMAALISMLSVAHAQSSSRSATPATAITLAPVVVRGILPGPALWKVSKGHHVMWILGLVSPVTKHMRWKFDAIDKRIAASQAVLKPPGLEVGADMNSSERASLQAWMRDIRKNPQDQRLWNILTPALYHRWRVQKNRYLPEDLYVESMRPIFAGRELYDAALANKGLVDQLTIEKTVYDAAHRHGVKIVDSAYQLVLGKPADAVAAFEKVDMDDQHCLTLVLDAVEHDLTEATVRANAWATGDIDTLSTVLTQPEKDSCLPAVGASPFAKAGDITDIQQRIDQSWIAHAEQALEDNTQTFALLPMDQLFKSDGYLSVLRSQGYTVKAPDESLPP